MGAKQSTQRTIQNTEFRLLLCIPFKIYCDKEYFSSIFTVSLCSYSSTLKLHKWQQWVFITCSVDNVFNIEEISCILAYTYNFMDKKSTFSPLGPATPGLPGSPFSPCAKNKNAYLLSFAESVGQNPVVL